MNLIELTIKGISYSQTQNGAYALVLSEVKGRRKLPIIIEVFEAQSIAIALEKEIKPPRPLTHDLFKSFADKFSISIKKVVIYKLIDGVFYSNLECEKGKKKQILDTRTSDAIAIAVRFKAPIFIHESILDKAGIYLKIEDEINLNQNNNYQKNEQDIDVSNTNPESIEDDFTIMTFIELNQKLEEAVINEDYEKAAKIRDEIRERSKNK